MSESQGSIRVVLDTNVLLRALARPFSKSAQLVRACEERRAIAILRKPVIDEYRHVLTVVGIGHNEITSTSIELVMRRKRFRRRAREVRIMTPNHLLRDHPHLAVEPDED